MQNLMNLINREINRGVECDTLLVSHSTYNALLNELGAKTQYSNSSFIGLKLYTMCGITEINPYE